MLCVRYTTICVSSRWGGRMNKEELRLTMIVSTLRDKLIELDEQEFVDWVEKTQFPKEELIWTKQ